MVAPQRSASRAWASGLALLLSSSLTLAARADATSAASPAPSERSATQRAALEHHERGVRYYDQQQYAEALSEFALAHALRPSPRLLFNLGQVYYQLGQFAKARSALERYQDDARSDPSRRAQVERQLEELRRKTGYLAISSNVPEARIQLDGEEVGLSPLAEPLLVDAGSHHVSATKPLFSSATRQTTVASQALANVHLSLVELRADPDATEVDPRATIAWVGTASLAAAALGTGLATRIAARRYERSLAELHAGPPGRARKDLQQQRSWVTSLALTTDVLAAATLAVAGFWIYVSLDTASTERTVSGVELAARLEF